MRSERLLPLLILLSACELEKVAIPSPASGVALHSVLSASAATQVVLLERTRNGTVYVSGLGFDVGDPVIGDGGIGESGALVRLTTPDGQVLLAREDRVSAIDGRGAGNYRFVLNGADLQRNATYKLTVQTVAGENLSAETSVPDGVVADAPEQRTLDRSADTLTLEWPASPGASSYFVRIETPFGPRMFFTDGTRIRLHGELRNLDTQTLQHVFIPGFPQAVTVSAVDANYYDWFRTHNDPLTGTGLVSRVQGGLGVFGSLVRLRYQALEVVTPQPEPAAGKFRFVGTATEQGTTPYLGIDLYIESRASRSGQPDALSGRYFVRGHLGYTGCLVCGAIGTVKDGQVVLSLLSGWSARDTTDTFIAELHGDTLVGRYRAQGGTARFVRQP